MVAVLRQLPPSLPPPVPPPSAAHWTPPPPWPGLLHQLLLFISRLSGETLEVVSRLALLFQAAASFFSSTCSEWTQTSDTGRPLLLRGCFCFHYLSAGPQPGCPAHPHHYSLHPQYVSHYRQFNVQLVLFRSQSNEQKALQHTKDKKNNCWKTQKTMKYLKSLHRVITLRNRHKRTSDRCETGTKRRRQQKTTKKH